MADAAAGYRYFEVEADVGVAAWGPTLADAFAAAALGALALTVSTDGVAVREVRDVLAHGSSTVDLMVAWVNECLYVHEIEGFAVARVEVTSLQPGLVHGRLLGEPLDTGRHRLGTVVKAATLHRASVSEAHGRAEVNLVVDV